jgi:hypothetical protein
MTLGIFPPLLPSQTSSEAAANILRGCCNRGRNVIRQIEVGLVAVCLHMSDYVYDSSFDFMNDLHTKKGFWVLTLNPTPITIILLTNLRENRSQIQLHLLQQIVQGIVHKIIHKMNEMVR